MNATRNSGRLRGALLALLFSLGLVLVGLVARDARVLPVARAASSVTVVTVNVVASITTTDSTEVTVYTPTSGKRGRVLGGSLALSVSGRVTFHYGAANPATPSLFSLGFLQYAPTAFDMTIARFVPGTYTPPGADLGASDAILTVKGTAGTMTGYLIVSEE